MDSSDPEVIVDQVSNLPATKETVLLLGLFFLQTDSSFEVRIMDDFAILASSTSKFGIEIPLVDDEDFKSSTESTVRLLQGALVILVLKQTSQFRSFGKRVFILCFPDFVATSTGCSKSDSRELPAGAGNYLSFELRQPLRKICQRIVCILVVIPLFILVWDF